jgi:superfamily II DNA or RNA helicase
MTWDYFLSQGLDLHVSERIDRASAERQKKTAQEILDRLVDQPGLVLADEVGMGKTYVALAVGLSITLVNPDSGPVVVMVPPSVKDKWPRDLAVFLEKCLKGRARDHVRATPVTIENGVAFLKLLDDPPAVRKNLIFMTHGALSRGLNDAFVKLALLRHVFGRRRAAGELRDIFPRFAGRILRQQRYGEDVWAALLAAPPEKWRALLEKAGFEVDDDPVPEALVNAMDALPDTVRDAIADALVDALPRRESANSDERARRAREKLNAVFDEIWQTWLAEGLKKIERLPLLIVDEAHHLKNPSTRLASLFVESEDDQKSLAGPLNGVFERMLFLTATPFQLGHEELLKVLERFANVAWQSTHAPRRPRSTFLAELDSLRGALDRAQHASLGLSRAWRRLTPAHLVDDEGREDDVDAWWFRLTSTQREARGAAADVLRHYRETHGAMRGAEQLLRPWVIRHLKPRAMASSTVSRRRTMPGAAITDEARVGGIDVDGVALLPFLLAARAEAAVAFQERGRALFADGLASSYEAYRDTRSPAATEVIDEAEATTAAPASNELEWYLKHIGEALPKDKHEATAAHPKVRATVDRVLQLWESGEKVLIFCHYRATGRALERHISRAIDGAITAVATRRFGLSPADAEARLERLGKRIQSGDDRLRLEMDRALLSLVDRSGQLPAAERDDAVDVLRRFLRTPALLARFFPADDGDDAPARTLAATDASGLSLAQRFEAFCDFLGRRCTAPERRAYLDALMTMQTGGRHERADDEGVKEKLLPNVRLVNGATKDETRRRLLLTFNTPFYPEILVASSVLAEGVDLHLDCRHVIHHDLCWNPSTLEQRTGRIDRLGAKAERAGASIHVYLPYVAATQDEKMFRVVRDRERWFQVVMGDPFGLETEADIERQASALALPEQAAADLAFRLSLDS